MNNFEQNFLYLLIFNKHHIQQFNNTLLITLEAIDLLHVLTLRKILQKVRKILQKE